MTDDDPTPAELSDHAAVFIAVTMAEARRAEAILDAHAIAYVVQVEPVGRTLFGSVRQGACFYVPTADTSRSGAALYAAGLGIGVLGPKDRRSD